MGVLWCGIERFYSLEVPRRHVVGRDGRHNGCHSTITRLIVVVVRGAMMIVAIVGVSGLTIIAMVYL